MNFDEEINYFESMKDDFDYIKKIGTVPILFTAAHTMSQTREDGSKKLAEPYTKAIAIYLNKMCDTSYLIKIRDTGIDSNKNVYDNFKEELINLVHDNNIKLVIDLHGASKKRDFDIEFGTLNNLTADFSTIKELEEAFIEKKIINIAHNNPFKGGGITQHLFGIEDVEVIQLEINGKFRDCNNIEDLKRVCDSLIYFVNQYVEYINR